MTKLMLFTAVIIAIFSAGASVDDKCAACKAVAEELEIQLLKEKPRNHIDMRNRLNSKGQREGKVIDYRYRRTASKPHCALYKQEAKAHANDISTYCGRLLEETEDELGEVIKNGSLQVGEVRKVWCQTLSKHCSQTSETYSGQEEEDDAHEL